ncbi:hypothetical protein [Haloarcula nitratireducens]|uniref:Pectate lyase superfamily protein domain-containing protein n=1 Tax=Haloarcula nitratireducens TaxID=2487749 RepID=A0AAW4PKN7_9EURY|nr:hypothetical protein [Halomicroarcula nitratireducens]MBX0297777.1 hypothetical protein [Halomicroarcula nitratireducens]
MVTVDSESDLSDTDAAAGQPAYAIDTQTFFLGQSDGTWEAQGKISSEQSGGSIQSDVTPDGAIVAPPGQVQSAIDRVANNGGGLVKLTASGNYRLPSSPWRVKSNVTLDFNGAVMRAQGERNDANIVYLAPRAQVLYPKIDLWNSGDGFDASNPYRGRVFSIDPSNWGLGYFADGTTIQGGYTLAVGAEGTWLYVGINKAENRGNHVSFVTINSNFGYPSYPNRKIADGEKSFETGIYFDSSGRSGGGGFINANFFYGNYQDASVSIRMEGPNPINKNVFNVNVQTTDGGKTIWRIEPQTAARENLMRGTIWDIGRLEGNAWQILSSFQSSDKPHHVCRDNHMNVLGATPEAVQNESGRAHWMTDAATNQTTQL